MSWWYLLTLTLVGGGALCTQEGSRLVRQNLARCTFTNVVWRRYLADDWELMTHWRYSLAAMLSSTLLTSLVKLPSTCLLRSASTLLVPAALSTGTTRAQGEARSRASRDMQKSHSHLLASLRNSALVFVLFVIMLMIVFTKTNVSSVTWRRIQTFTSGIGATFATPCQPRSQRMSSVLSPQCFSFHKNKKKRKCLAMLLLLLIR